MSDLVKRLRLDGLPNSIKEEAADRIEQLEAAQERLWCKACGTVTRDQTCDCNRWHNEMSREPNFVNYADAMQEAAHEQAHRIEQLEAALREFVSCFSKANHGWDTTKLYRLRENVKAALAPASAALQRGKQEQEK